jgi:hypothetical protein
MVDMTADDPAWLVALRHSLRTFHERPVSALVPLPLEVALPDVLDVLTVGTPHQGTLALILEDLRRSLGDPRQALPVALARADGPVTTQTKCMVTVVTAWSDRRGRQRPSSRRRAAVS